MSSSQDPGSSVADQATGPTSTSSEQGSSTSSLANRYVPQSRFSFPAAAQPEIVRAYQKDTYYKDLFVSQLQDVIRSLLGVRVVHSNIQNISLAGSLAYYLLSTSSLSKNGQGGQTLGEEYVNAVPTSSKTGKLVSTRRRLGFVLLHVLSPYLLTKLYASLRRYTIRKTEAAQQADQRARARARALNKDYISQNPPTRRILRWLAKNLPALETLKSQDGWLAYLAAAHLMLFYLGGRFYSFAQRVMGIQYISTIPKRPGYQPPSYEVLGVLLGIQLTVKFGMGILQWRSAAASAAVNSKNVTDSTPQQTDPSTTVSIDSKTYSHASQPPKLVTAAGEEEGDQIELHYPHLPEDDEQESGYEKQQDSEDVAVAKLNTAAAQANAQSSLQCTLCMDQRTPHKGTSAVTECGHCFDWSCIVAWAQEKPECPLCRQQLQVHRILPIYNF